MLLYALLYTEVLLCVMSYEPSLDILLRGILAALSKSILA